MDYFNYGYVYKIQFPNNKVYIGSSRLPGDRFVAHLQALRNNKHQNIFVQLYYNRYGEEKLIFLVIEKCSPPKMRKREIYWIKKFGKRSVNICNNLYMQKNKKISVLFRENQTLPFSSPKSKRI